jgi:low temperature requirement protein LtrA
VADVDPVVAALTFHGAGLIFPDGLRPRALGHKRELPVRVVLLASALERQDPKREAHLAVDVLVQGIVVALLIAQDQRRPSRLALLVTALQELREHAARLGILEYRYHLRAPRTDTIARVPVVGSHNRTGSTEPTKSRIRGVVVFCEERQSTCLPGEGLTQGSGPYLSERADNPSVRAIRNPKAPCENENGCEQMVAKGGSMSQGWGRTGLLRARGGGEQAVTPLELFFDLVYVFAVTQLSHLLLAHLTVGGVLQTLFLLFVVWWAWQYTTWFTNWFDPDVLPVRLILVAVMLASLVMSVAIPGAFGESGLMFAIAYVAIQVGRTTFAVFALGASHPLGGGFRRILAWFSAAGVLWVAGGLLEGEARYELWLLALATDYFGPVVGYWTPGLGRSRTEEWTIEGAHFAERCQLIVIIALGESILVTGTTFSEITVSATTVAAFVVAFLGSAALWWIYFARSAYDASEAIVRSDDPGRMARSAYTYSHLPMIAGVIAVAAADELILAHPADPGTVASIWLILGGTALFVAGDGFFVWAVSDRVLWSRLVAALALTALAPVGFVVPALALSAITALVVVLLAAWDAAAYRKNLRPPRGAVT